jgi:DNA-binding transcriptional ArsR family regulator
MTKLLEKLFGSRTRARLLGWLFSHSGESFSVRQLASILGDDPSNLSREMAKLEDLGILISSRERNLKRFRVNDDCAFGPELKGLIQKTTGIIGRLQATLQTVKGIDIAFVYGSFAKGTENADSDVDLLVVGETDPEFSRLALRFNQMRMKRHAFIYEAEKPVTRTEAEISLNSAGEFVDEIAGRVKTLI